MKKGTKRKATSKPKKKKSVQDNSTAIECQEYRESRSDLVCETCELLRTDKVAAEWCDNQRNAEWTLRTDVHHIFGRGRAIELDWFCCLILVCPACHRYAHDKSPANFEIVCLASKLMLHKRDLELAEIGLKLLHREDRLNWNSRVFDAVCGNDSLAGRIEAILVPRITGDKFLELARIVWKYLQLENTRKGTNGNVD